MTVLPGCTRSNLVIRFLPVKSALAFCTDVMCHRVKGDLKRIIAAAVDYFRSEPGVVGSTTGRQRLLPISGSEHAGTGAQWHSQQ